MAQGLVNPWTNQKLYIIGMGSPTRNGNSVKTGTIYIEDVPIHSLPPNLSERLLRLRVPSLLPSSRGC